MTEEQVIKGNAMMEEGKTLQRYIDALTEIIGDGPRPLPNAECEECSELEGEVGELYANLVTRREGIASELTIMPNLVGETLIKAREVAQDRLAVVTRLFNEL